MAFAVIACGVLSISSPFWAGDWMIAILGLAVFGSAAVSLLRTFFTRAQDAAERRYFESVVLLLVGLVFYYSPSLILRGAVGVIGILLVIDGVMKMTALLKRGTEGRVWDAFNGVVYVAAGLLAILYRHSVTPTFVGLAIGIWLVSIGWEMYFHRRDDMTGEPPEFAPGRVLGIPDDPELRRLSEAALASQSDRYRVDLRWSIALAGIFFAIHIGRMDLQWNVLGVVSTSVAVIGDLLFAVVLAMTIVMPGRLVWRRLTRAIERAAWKRRLGRGSTDIPFGERMVEHWLDGRLRFDARLHTMKGSFSTALATIIKIGLPLTAILVAINPIWGFSWFFNTENWVSGFWQRLVELRVDPWRAAMIDAVAAQQGAPASDAPGLFEVHPAGVAESTDFAFLILGDTGEGDASQHSLKDRYLLEGRRADIKFLVVSSDVIYPAGAMKDYEFNFFLPFKGFEKPIYAIPGNHDWFGALDAFNANFLEAGAARAAMRARLDADHLLTRAAETRVDRMITTAERLRGAYKVDIGHQRAPFFEIHAPGFSLITVDTGILKRLDDRERRWFEAALERARGQFTMVVLGHPIYAAGENQGLHDEGFGELHELLKRYEVPVVLAGDTHDFEYYRERYDAPAGSKVMHHFVNGGGGAYLSIGTALDWPAEPPVADWAFYPSTAAVHAKLEAETPMWKRPVWWWLNTAGGWPASAEGLSGAFDFNRAPFLQSFFEVRVEGSMRQVRLILHGVHGPLTWGELQTGGAVIPPDKGPADTVEFIVPM